MQGKKVEELRKRLIGKARKQVQEKYTGKEGHNPCGSHNAGP